MAREFEPGFSLVSHTLTLYIFAPWSFPFTLRPLGPLVFLGLMMIKGELKQDGHEFHTTSILGTA